MKDLAQKKVGAQKGSITGNSGQSFTDTSLSSLLKMELIAQIEIRQLDAGYLWNSGRICEV